MQNDPHAPVHPLVDIYFGALRTQMFASNEAMGRAAAADAARVISASLQERGRANVVLATGNSQLSFLHALREEDVDWGRVGIFHMDQYVGMEPDHPASFPRFLQQHFLDYVDVGEFFPISGNAADPFDTCKRYADLLTANPPDFVALGIGENGHLAFNDPPDARFDDPALVRVVDLAVESRRQQVGEGHFPTLDDVPAQAITLTIPALLSARTVYALVPERRKASIVQRCLTRPIAESVPATVLRIFRNARLYLDQDSGGQVFAAPDSQSARNLRVGRT